MVDWYVNLKPENPKKPTRAEGTLVTMRAPRTGHPSDDHRVDWEAVPQQENINALPLEFKTDDDPEDGGSFHNSVELPPYGLDEYDFRVSIRGKNRWKKTRLVTKRKLFFKVNWTDDPDLRSLWNAAKDDFSEIFRNVGIELECLGENALNIREPFDAFGDTEAGSNFRELIEQQSPYPEQHKWQFFRIILVKSGTIWAQSHNETVELSDATWDGNHYRFRLKMPLSATRKFSRRDMLDTRIRVLNQQGRFSEKFQNLAGNLPASDIHYSHDNDYSYLDIELDSSLNDNLRLLAEWQQFFQKIIGDSNVVVRADLPDADDEAYGNDVMQWSLFSTEQNKTGFPQVEARVRTSEPFKAFVAGRPVIVISEEAARAKVVNRTDHPAAFARMLAHELGHLLDMVPDKRKINGRMEPHPRPYTDKGAEGPHCAHNIVEVPHKPMDAGAFYNPSVASEANIYIPGGTGANGPCIMFGITHAHQHEVSFCKACARFLRAGDLSIAGMQKLKDNDVDWDNGY